MRTCPTGLELHRCFLLCSQTLRSFWINADRAVLAIESFARQRDRTFCIVHEDSSLTKALHPPFASTEQPQRTNATIPEHISPVRRRWRMTMGVLAGAG